MLKTFQMTYRSVRRVWKNRDHCIDMIQRESPHTPRRKRAAITPHCQAFFYCKRNPPPLAVVRQFTNWRRFRLCLNGLFQHTATGSGLRPLQAPFQGAQ